MLRYSNFSGIIERKVKMWKKIKMLRWIYLVQTPHFLSPPKGPGCIFLIKILRRALVKEHLKS